MPSAGSAIYTSQLQIPVIDEIREDIDQIAQFENISIAEVCRGIITPEAILQRRQQHNLLAFDCQQRPRGGAYRTGAKCYPCTVSDEVEG